MDPNSVRQRVDAATAAIKAGGMVVMVDDENRENEGDLVFASEHCSPEKINFMAKEARGLICLSMPGPRLDRLNLPLMRGQVGSRGSSSTAFTVSIEAAAGVTTGISAADRSKTIEVATSPDVQSHDIVVPGHVFPLRAESGGVLTRAGHTEGSMDLAKIAGFSGCAVICEIMKDDGTMARLPDLQVFAKKHGLPIVSIADLIQHRLDKGSFLKLVHQKPCTIAGVAGEGSEAVQLSLFKSEIDHSFHFALCKGAGQFSGLTDKPATVDVRVISGRPLQDLLSVITGEAGSKLQKSRELFAQHENVVVLYLNNFSEEDILNDASLLMDQGSKKVQNSAMNFKQYGTGAQILRMLGVKKMRVHTSSPRSMAGLTGFGLELVSSVDLETSAGPEA